MRILEVRRLLKEDGKLIGYSIVTDEMYNTVNSSSRYDVSIHTFEGVYTIESADGSKLGSEVMQVRGSNYVGKYVKGQVVYDSNRINIDKVIDLFREDEGCEYVLKYYKVNLFEHKKRADGVDIATSDSVCSNNHSKHLNNIDNYNIKNDKSKGKIKIKSENVVDALKEILGDIDCSSKGSSNNNINIDNTLWDSWGVREDDKDFSVEVSSNNHIVDSKDGTFSKLYAKIKEDVCGLLSSISTHFNVLLEKYFKMVLSKQQDTSDEIKSLKAEINALRGIIEDIPTQKEYVEVYKDRIVEVPVKEVIHEVGYNNEDIDAMLNGINYITDLLKDNKVVSTTTHTEKVIVESVSNLKTKDRRVTTKEFLYLVRDLNNAMGNKWMDIGYKIYTEHKSVLDRAESLGNYSVITIPENGKYKGRETVDGDKLRTLMRKFDVYMNDAID